ncbi:NHLP leader peptide family RiPP precursor [Longimicrobium sp.]|uniref:NHLP leader peptide family RiPP precursor n=1 Tax=Longimicrobium sp. TaxID=2029185 RepID=UPI002C828818|nr:NHLP leader peptide family RiPP precursor [Longimicrobium sp.]HSU13255.1 NHLP leader peptide family RiPP precursor [Longimicrobium sp.]
MSDFTQYLAAAYDGLYLWGIPIEPPHGRIGLMRRKDLEIMLVANAIRDQRYRQRLLEDARSLIQETTGLIIPEDISIHVLEESGANVYLVIPHDPWHSNEEMPATRERMEWLLTWHRSTLLNEDQCVQLITKAWTDNAFAGALVSNPRETIEQWLGLNLPAELSIETLVEKSDTVYIILPERSRSWDPVGTDAAWARVNIDPVFVEVLQSGVPVDDRTIYGPLCADKPGTQRDWWCFQAACTYCKATLQ